MKTLKHNFKSKVGEINLAGIVGYTECMVSILEYLNSKNKIMIEADELRDIIYATNDELVTLRPDFIIETDKPDTLFEQISNVVKTDVKNRYNIDL